MDLGHHDINGDLTEQIVVLIDSGHACGAKICVEVQVGDADVSGNGISGGSQGGDDVGIVGNDAIGSNLADVGQCAVGFVEVVEGSEAMGAFETALKGKKSTGEAAIMSAVQVFVDEGHGATVAESEQFLAGGEHGEEGIAGDGVEQGCLRLGVEGHGGKIFADG